MKNLVYSTLIAAVASQAAGCIIIDGDNDNNLGAVEVSWALKSTTVTRDTRPNAPPNSYLSVDAIAACPAGATTATLFALPAGAPVTSAFVDKYDCIDGRGIVADLEPGTYTVWLQLNDTAGATKFAESASQQIVVNAGATSSAPYDLFVDRGFFLVGWNLNRAGATSCAAVANNGVSILATDGGGAMAGFDTLVNCAEGEGRQTISQPMPIRPVIAGTTALYTVAVSLLNQADQSIGDATPVPNRGFENFGNSFADLGIVRINVR